jgi:enediyne biosynthesis protein E4
MINQVIAIRKKYPTYQAYGRASIDQLLTAKERENGLLFTATDMNSSYIENRSNGKFSIRPLPAESQFAPVYGLLAQDINNDGHTDILLTGNDYGMEPYSGRHDAFNGLVLEGDGKGHFSSMAIDSSGFFVNGDGKALAWLHTAKQGDIIIATQNQDSIKVFEKRLPQNTKNKKWFSLQQGDFSAELFTRGGSKRKLEFYHGAGYLSQSSRKIMVDNNTVKLIITDYRGIKREVKILQTQQD